jgi:hypothetical protein
MELDPGIAILMVVTCCVGYLMTIAGLGKNALELRRRQRICPSCGRRIHARVCHACTS